MRSMSPTGRAVLLLAVQAVLVLSIAGKYLYERMTCPRVWVKAAQYDPNAPLRGRYLAMQLVIDAYGLPRDEAHQLGGFARPGVPGEATSWRWRVMPLARDGKLVVAPAGYNEGPVLTENLTLFANRPCDRATLSESVEYFIPDTAKNPFPAKEGEELWVEVTVPPMGPPRSIQLAVSKDGVFTPLDLR
jgi:hypothetical protein